MEKIKLIIWDLDETFWKGTLSEEGIEPIQFNIDLVKALTNKGIMNSIVSKNDYNLVKNELIKLGIWDYFIFPSIAWLPKGQLIKDLLEKAQLRAPNVLFLDDNHSNLEEAVFYNPGLNIELPDFINLIPTHDSFIGKDDSEHSRLKQYKILEEKSLDIINFSNNDDFLLASEIKVTLIYDLEYYSDRIYELIERTNQLNFTKKRFSQTSVDKLVNDDSLSQFVVSVSDKYGDYGIVGYCAYSEKSHRLEHFVFSCRILNLGVEQYIYSKLNFPEIDIIPSVAIELDSISSPNWITESELRPNSLNFEQNNDAIRILFKGGCDLSQMLFYINGDKVNVVEETNYVTKDNVSIHNEHTYLLLQEEENTKLKIPLLDEGSSKSLVFNSEYDVLIYSVLMDYTQELYLNKETGLLFPHGGYYNFLSEESNQDILLEQFRKMNSKGLDKTFLSNFRENFVHIGKITPSDFVGNLSKLRNRISPSIPIVFINGAEVDSNELEVGAKDRHISMNKALDDFIANNQNCYLLDVRKYVYDLNHVTGNVRHYQRSKYRDLALELKSIIDDVINIKDAFKIKNSNSVKEKALNSNFIRNLWKTYVPSRMKNFIKKFI
ncbi:MULTISPECIES: hypothetical protein [unclassified Sphingobacterium]|uniref:hypothetical protein n=1 Tax=unclassified Sphingobacterium TaxID=2609468 RepID=UPI001051A726|nr:MULTISPECIES: hypothetical protein [unclassified Sphingobacterium]MCS3555842.1 FkbH-like protein [Sphingobacterium sp. JUb21]TCR00705.1 FkbH-like protein [Sphingobacterium sp. JUb20]